MNNKQLKVPNDWRIEKFDLLTTSIRSGLSRRLSLIDIGLPVVNSGNLQDEGLDMSDLKYWYSDDPQGANTQDYYLKNDDILLNFINSISQIGKSAIYFDIGRPTIYTTNLFRIRVNKEILPKYLFAYMQSKSFKKHLELSTKPAVNQASFTRADLAKIPVLVPPLAEQKKIIPIINTIDTVLYKTRKKIEKLQDLKIATMNKLLIKGIGNKEFKDSEFGQIPKNWELIRLRDICEKITDRDHTTPTYVNPNEGIPIISPININSDMELEFTKLKYISKEAHQKNRKKTDLLPDDIIFSRIGAGLGKSYLVKNEFYDFSILHSICQIRVKRDRIFSNYLLWQMRTSLFQKNLWLGVQSIGVPDLGLGEIGNLRIPICSFSEQIKIARVLDKIHDQILLTKRKLFQAQFLRKSLIEDLLTGKVRVQVK